MLFATDMNDDMKAEEIFKKSVDVMKGLLTPQGMKDSIRRAKTRSEEENTALLNRERRNVNELVRKVAGTGGSHAVLNGVQADIIDAMVLRYLRNRDVFMKTFPDGIEDIDSEPVAIWAAIMISPMDEPQEGE